jgi:hypothetical protein
VNVSLPGISLELIGAGAAGDAIVAGARADRVGQRPGHDRVVAAGGVELLGPAVVEREAACPTRRSCRRGRPW